MLRTHIFNSRFWKTAATTASAAALSLILTTGYASADAQFRKWVSSFRPVALQNRIAPATFDRAFAGVNAIDPEVLQKRVISLSLRPLR